MRPRNMSEKSYSDTGTDEVQSTEELADLNRPMIIKTVLTLDACETFYSNLQMSQLHKLFLHLSSTAVRLALLL